MASSADAQLLPTLQGGPGDHGATENRTFKTRAPYSHTILQWTLFGVPLRYITCDDGTLPA